MIYFCCDERRRTLVKEAAKDAKHPKDVNGIDFVEVEDDRAHPDWLRQRRIFVHFINANHVAGLTKDNFRIEGGERIPTVRVTAVSSGAGSVADPAILILDVDQPGDFSVYTLRIVKGSSGDGKDDPPEGFDPVLSEVDLEFKAGCDTDFDCGKKKPCRREPRTAPAIDYLAKDYASFRQLLLDRMAVLMPKWTERHAADLGVTLIELLAYAGDYLSYRQDAVSTEAYIGTARRRVSVRRHARLVDYPMHDGTNARVWVRVEVKGTVTLPERKDSVTQFISRVTIPGAAMPLRLKHDSVEWKEVMAARAKVFELVDAPELNKLDERYNEMYFHTWGAEECCLPRGATTADLKGDLEGLKEKIVVFAEVVGPKTGDKRDADRTHRHAVRIIAAKKFPAKDPIETIDVTRVEWAEADALPFPICVSSKDEDGVTVSNVSEAWGNIVLADHGRTVTGVSIGPVPSPNSALTPRVETGHCNAKETKPPAARFTPELPDRNITFEAPYDAKLPASELLEVTPRQIAPLSMSLVEKTPAARQWEARTHLLNADNTDALFVVETESNGTAWLRFGDGVAGAQPEAGTTFKAKYRVGNGIEGNIGADSIASFVSNYDQVSFPSGSIDSVSNPLPARGGLDPESMDRVRRNAPAAFRVQERAVTAADYATMAQRCSNDVQRAAGTFRWTGSWHTVFVTVDRKGGRDAAEPKFRYRLQRCLDRYRMAGHDLHFDVPRFVPLLIVMSVCVKRDYSKSDVESALREVLGTGTLDDGRLGFFHPDNFTFGQPLYLSKLLATAQGVEGVDSIEIKILERKGKPSRTAFQTGSLEVGPLEIIQLENDPNFPERGLLTLEMRGGR